MCWTVELQPTEVSGMSEKEDFKAAKESLAEVVSRGGRRSKSDGVIRRLVDAAFYRDTHRAQPDAGSTKKTEKPAGGTG
jgi:hypothetical protein